MSSAKARDSREIASCAGVGHGGEQGRKRGGEEGQGICVKRETSEGGWGVYEERSNEWGLGVVQED